MNASTNNNKTNIVNELKTNDVAFAGDIVNVSDIALQTANDTIGSSLHAKTTETTLPTNNELPLSPMNDANITTTNEIVSINDNTASIQQEKKGTEEILATTTASIKLATPTGIPVFNQSNNLPNRFMTSASSSVANTSSNAKPTASTPHQRSITTTGTANTVKLKKSDTGRGALDFLPKSASTDKSRLESLLINRNIPTSVLNALPTQDAAFTATGLSNQQTSGDSAIRVSHSYRTKAEILQQNSNIPIQQSQESAATTVGGASLLTSNLNNPSINNNNTINNITNIKSQSAVPIKQSNDNASINSSNSQKNELRPR